MYANKPIAIQTITMRVIHTTTTSSTTIPIVVVYQQHRYQVTYHDMHTHTIFHITITKLNTFSSR